MPELEFPECPPAILIGIDTLRPELANVPPWAHSVHHQHGGYACRQAQFYGALLPLAAVPACEPLMSGFAALASDAPNRRSFGRHPELLSLHLTCGQSYQRGQLDVLEDFLAKARFKFPQLLRGTEALLDFGESRQDAFRGWPLFTLQGPECFPLEASASRHLGGIGPRHGYPQRTLSHEAIARLKALVGAPLRTYLLWENSD